MNVIVNALLRTALFPSLRLLPRLSLLVPFTSPSSRSHLSVPLTSSSPQPKKTSLINTAVFLPYIPPLVEICYDIAETKESDEILALFARYCDNFLMYIILNT